MKPTSWLAIGCHHHDSCIDTLKITLLLFTAGLFTGCGSGSDAPVVDNIDTRSPTSVGFVYQGPAPQTAEIQTFRVTLFDNLVEDRCGTCHGVDQPPLFLERDDINIAFAETVSNNLVDLGSPRASRLVERAAEGHNCWLDSPAACADIMATLISNWANGSTTASNTIVLTEPELRDPGQTRSFPQTPERFEQTVYPIVTTYCSQCHSETSAVQQQPFFASPNIELAYSNAQTRIDLQSPTNSRFVVRLGSEFHNCWSDCQDNGRQMQIAIETFANGLELTEVDPNLVISRAVGFADGVAASTGGRVETNAIALYQFSTGEGFTAFDTSGIDPALNLTLSGDVEWISSGGLRLRGGKAQGSTAASSKLHELITATGEYSIEAWVVPANVTQEGPARIVSYSGSDQTRNLTLGQTLYDYNYFNRSTATDANGAPFLSTPTAEEVLQATLQHVVVSYDPVTGRRIHVNGQRRSDTDTSAGATIGNWDDSFALVLGNEVSNNLPWMGSLRLLAIHNRALSEQDIQTNFDAGVGERFFLLFHIGGLIDVPQGYIVFEAAQFDEFSYLFNQPFFVDLSGNGQQLASTPLVGMRIGVNGKESPQGQAFATLDTQLSGADYGEMGQPLSDVGTVIAVENGIEQDEFFLTFDQLGTHNSVRIEQPLITPEAPLDQPQSRVGLRTFAEINASLATITSVPSTHPAIAPVFQQVQQQLPSSPEISGFVAAHQMGINQLAVEYCNQLTLPANNLRQAYFPGFDFEQPAGQAFDTSGRAQIIDPLLAALLAREVNGSGLSDQPAPNEVRALLNQLIDQLLGRCGPNCGQDSTRNLVTAVCSAAAGSALMLVQ